MLHRKIQETVRDYFREHSRKILIIEGARQVGKSYIIRHEGQAAFPNYVEVNMVEDKEKDRYFERVRTTEEFYLTLSALAGDRLGRREDTLVFLDEIQAYPHLLTLLKFLKDEDRYTYIASGSELGITLRETLSYPGGRIRIEKMYPLDFEEFLWANHIGQEAIEHLREAFRERRSPEAAMHDRMMSLFRRYLLVGGLPDAVNAYLETRNIVEVRQVHDEIIALYKNDASQYDEAHTLMIRQIYEMIPSQMENRKKRIVYRDIEQKKGKRASDYGPEFEYLVHSGISIEVRAISNPRFPLIESAQKTLLKLYLNDPGLLTDVLYRFNVRAILDDLRSVNLGSVYETAVACELRAHGYPLFYYDQKKSGEVDFLTDDYDTLSVVPLEVKSGKDYQVHRALDKFLANPAYPIRQAFVLSNGREVVQKGKTCYIPVYYIMFLQPSAPGAMQF